MFDKKLKHASARKTPPAQSGHQKYLLSMLPAANGTAATMCIATYCCHMAKATERLPITAAIMDGVLVFIFLWCVRTLLSS